MMVIRLVDRHTTLFVPCHVNVNDLLTLLTIYPCNGIVCLFEFIQEAQELLNKQGTEFFLQLNKDGSLLLHPCTLSISTCQHPMILIGLDQ